MAIQNSKTTAAGVTGNYWRFLTITVDRESFQVSGRIALFKDKATSDAGGTHLGLIKSFNFTYTMGDISGAGDIVAFMYTKVLAKANTTVSKGIDGETLGSPVSFDPDIAGGTIV